jgi:hypothetical protein
MPKNITDYLVDEGSYEEEEYLGELVDEKAKDGAELTVERDEELLKVSAIACAQNFYSFCIGF